MRTAWLFRGAVILSLAAHGAFLALRAGGEDDPLARIIRIPVMLEAQAEEPPPEPEPPPPEPEKKPRPRELARHVREVVAGDGLRTGDLVEAEVGAYAEEAEAPLPPPPPPPPPKPKPPEPEVDRAEVARTFLAGLRDELTRRRRYPVAAQRMGVTGSVTVSFVVRPDSTFGELAIRRSSGHDILDRAALDTVRGLSGALARPPALGDVPLRTSVILRYELNG